MIIILANNKKNTLINQNKLIKLLMKTIKMILNKKKKLIYK